MTDQTPNQTNPTMKEAVAILYTAQHELSAKTDYERFYGDVSVQKIPWDFEDPRFLARIKKLKEDLVGRLNLKNEEELQAVANEVVSQVLSPDELEGMGRGLEKAQQLKKDHREHIFHYTKSVVDGYVQKLKEQNVPFTEEQERSLRSSVVRAGEQAMGAGNTVELQKTISSLVPPGVEVPEEIQTAVSNAGRLSKITETALTAEDEIHKGLLIEQCLNNPDISPELIVNKFSGLREAQEVREAKILSLSDGVRTQIETELDTKTGLEDITKRGAAFRQATTGISQPINDVITAVGGPQGKEFISSVIDTVLGTSIEDVKAGSPIAEHHPSFSSNPLMQEKIQMMEESLGKRKTARDDEQKTSKPIFRQETIDTAVGLWGPQIQNGLVMYLETASIKASSYAPEYFHYFILARTGAWRSIVGGSTNVAVKKTIGEILRSFFGKGGGGAAAGRAAGLTAAKAAGGGIFGGPVGALLMVAGDKIVSFVGGAIKGLFSFLKFDKWAERQIIQTPWGPAERKSWWEDMDWVVAITCVAGLIILSGLTLLRETSSTAAIVAEKEELGGGGLNQGTGGDTWPAGPITPPATNVSFVVPPPIKVCDPATGTSCVVFQPGPAGVGDSNCGSGSESSDFTEEEWAMVQDALNILSQSSSFMSYVNNGQPITISRNRTDYGGGCYISGNSPRIVLYNSAFSSPAILLYTITHELGHAIAHNNPDVLNSFYSSGIIASEGYLPSYPNEKTSSEDFAETLGLYAFYSSSSKYKNYPDAYPNHFAFAKGVFGGVTIKPSP